MKHLNGHETVIKDIKHTPQGVSFTVRCCDAHEESSHIQNAHKFAGDKKALLRVLMEHQRKVSEQHEAHAVVEEIIQECAANPDCGCGK